MSEPTDRFVHGLCTGLAVLVVLIQLVFAIEFRELPAIYADFGNVVELSPMTQLVLRPLWQWGVPLVGAALVAALIRWRPRHLALYVAVAVLVIVAAGLTWYFARAPMFALAGTIK